MADPVVITETAALAALIEDAWERSDHGTSRLRPGEADAMAQALLTAGLAPKPAAIAQLLEQQGGTHGRG